MWLISNIDKQEFKLKIINNPSFLKKCCSLIMIKWIKSVSSVSYWASVYSDIRIERVEDVLISNDTVNKWVCKE